MTRTLLRSFCNKFSRPPVQSPQRASVQRISAGFVIALCLGSCGAIPPSPENFGRLEVHESDDGSTLVFASASAFGGGWTMQTRYRLRGHRDKATNAISHELYVRIWYNEGGLRDFVTATVAGNRELAVTKIGNQPAYVGRRFGAHEEWIGIPLDDAWLNSIGSSGFDVRLKAQSGHEILLSVPAAYVMAYLDSVSTLR